MRGNAGRICYYHQTVSGERTVLWMKTKRVFLLLLCFLQLSMAACGAQSGTKKISIKADDPYMSEAIKEAIEGITHHHGGPFGCVIVKDEKIVGRGHNMVLANNDSTAHGEITAIRNAEKALGTYDLSGCILYTTGEPCPMCLYAILWANIDKVYYGCTIEDSAAIGFRDAQFDQLAGGREARTDYLVCIDREACLELFEFYQNMEHRIY